MVKTVSAVRIGKCPGGAKGDRFYGKLSASTLNAAFTLMSISKNRHSC
jgi:hypothetical protein